MDFTLVWLDTENINSINMDVKGHKYVHPDSDIKSRPSVRSMEKLKEMYPKCFSGIGEIQGLQVPHCA